jgi:hypothetical protein
MEGVPLSVSDVGLLRKTSFLCIDVDLLWKCGCAISEARCHVIITNLLH